MIETSIIVKNRTGLHARPASIVVEAVKKFKSTITIIKGEKEVNTKSILGLLSLGAIMGDEIIIRADGGDEHEALETVVNIMMNLEE